MFNRLRSWPGIALFFVGALVLSLMGYREHSEVAALSDHGLAATARITEVNWATKRGIDRNFKLTVAFERKDGQTASEEISVDSDLGKRARDDDSFVEVGIRYLPEDPSIVRLAGEGDHSNGFYLVAAGLALLGAIFLALRLRAKSDER